MNQAWRARIELPFADRMLELALPDGWCLDVLRVMGPADLPEPGRALRHTLESPVHALPLSKALPASGPVLILISPAARPGALPELLREFLVALRQRGLQDQDIHLMFCHGEGEALGPLGQEALVGREMLAAHPHFEHDPDGPTRDCGRTERGTPVAFNARLWDYRMLIPLAAVAHHPESGFSGGPDLLATGAVARMTMDAYRDLAKGDLASGRVPGVEPGRLEGNPLYGELCEVVERVEQPVFLVNWIEGSRPGRYAGFWAGELNRAFRRACQAYMGWRAFSVLSPGYDLVLSASGGTPGDDHAPRVATGMINASRLLKPGGHLLHLARCGQGFVLPTEVLRRLRSAAAHFSFHLVSELPPELVSGLGIVPGEKLEQSFKTILAALPDDPMVAFFPDALEFLPVYA